MYELPYYVWALVLAGAIGIPVATSAVLYRGALAAGVGHRAATVVAATSAAGLGGWLVLSGLLAGAGVYSLDPGEGVPWLLVVFTATLTALFCWPPGSPSFPASSPTRAPPRASPCRTRCGWWGCCS